MNNTSSSLMKRCVGYFIFAFPVLRSVAFRQSPAPVSTFWSVGPSNLLKENANVELKRGSKHNLTHSQSLHSDSSYSSTLTLSIVTSSRCSLAKTFLTLPISVRRLFGALGSSLEGTNSYWLMLWVIAESSKLKKK